jgi:hypothetical protein
MAGTSPAMMKKYFNVNPLSCGTRQLVHQIQE